MQRPVDADDAGGHGDGDHRPDPAGELEANRRARGAIPIALLSNIIRIVATGWCYYYIEGEKAKQRAHDWSGYLMMPLALLLVGIELMILSWLAADSGEDDQADVPRRRPCPREAGGGQGQDRSPNRRTLRVRKETDGGSRWISTTNLSNSMKAPRTAASPGRVSGRPAVFLDRDGTLIEHVHYLPTRAASGCCPARPEAIKRLRHAGFACVLVTNQSAVGRGMITEARLHEIHAEMDRQLAERGAALDARIYYCTDVPSGNDRTDRQERNRKPGRRHVAAGRDRTGPGLCRPPGWWAT